MDKTKRYGDCDVDGYMYAASFDRLLEMIRSRTAMGAPSKASIVRRRCYVRPKRCVSETVKKSLSQAIANLAAAKARVEKSLREKRCEMAILMSFEQRRTQSFGEIIDRCLTGHANAIELLKLLSYKLATLRQVRHYDACVDCTSCPCYSLFLLRSFSLIEAV